MHDEPQIQDSLRTDVTDISDTTARPRDRDICYSCGRRNVGVDLNEYCKGCIEKYTCKCGKIFINIREHKKQCEDYKKFRSDVNRLNSLKAAEKIKNMPKDELAIYYKAIGEKVSATIAAGGEKEKERRRSVANKGLTLYNKSERGRKKSSETAKITSARPDIQQRRGELLNNLCVTKPEKDLLDFVNSINKSFKRSKSIYSELFSCKSKRRQIDVYSDELKIFIEYDGPLHFKETSWKDDIYARIERDNEIEFYSIENRICLIRISFDQYSNDFTSNCKEFIRNIMLDCKPGIYRLGKMYGENNLL